MSYSRWSASQWYTFWSTHSNDHRRGQIFCICSVVDFTAGEICDNIEKCLDTAVDKYLEDYITQQSMSGARKELRRYMIQFIKDVNKEDKLKGNCVKIKD